MSFVKKKKKSKLFHVAIAIDTGLPLKWMGKVKILLGTFTKGGIFHDITKEGSYVV